jgi:hypothetical protein
MIQVILILLIPIFTITYIKYRYINKVKNMFSEIFIEDTVITSIKLDIIKKTKFEDYQCIFYIIDKENRREIECRMHIKLTDDNEFIISSIKRFYYNKICQFLKVKIDEKKIK